MAKPAIQIDSTGLSEVVLDSEQSPRNWPLERKIWITSILIFLEFFVTVIATTGSSASYYARPDFSNTSNMALMTSFISTYCLGQAVGSITIPQFTESHGRRWFYVWSSLSFSLTCAFTGFTKPLVGVVLGRFLSGLSSAVPAVVVAGSIEDLFNEKQRIWPIWSWNCFTVAGQVLGPVYGSYIASALDWRWVYYIAAIITAAILPFVGLVPETRHFKVIGKKAAESMESGNSERSTHNPDASFSAAYILGRPARLLFTEPLVFVATLLCSFSMGLLYLFTESLSTVYTSPGFDFSHERASLPFLAMVAGITLSMLPRIYDIKQFQRHTEMTSRAELKLLGCLLGAPALAIGLWLFAWTVPPYQTNLHPIVSMLGLALVGFAATEISYTLQGYLADCYTIYASSALSGLACVRAIFSGLIPLAGHDMFANLGNNHAGSLLAAIATVFAIFPVAFYFYGRELRARSPFARASLEHES